MLFKSDQSPISENFTYALTYSFSEDGYVSDSDVNEINYDELLKSMKEDISEGNEARIKEGYPAMELVGWANKPFYDASSKKLHWAKEIKFEGDAVNTLNYNIRILGRKGILELNAISDVEKLKLVQNDIPAILASTEFNDGEKYSDYSPGIDKMAAYGIGGLIAGKVLAKAGFFALLLKFWKIIALGAIAALGFLKKILTKKADNSSV
ncbi:PF09935 family protein [Leptospira yanagawae serovar Saopaulo str. Sao Paulo = ATCC 700523]|uniref:PF09935 family protein n=1 Tax=Leptospira yanagawae serovar Saopaulo str. Sao Paulo = ATCC 700523 TaxID=1249483 RepID=A0A5E8HE90_9LEPT|nr:PF09935 family protein [Leptospira yanagawae serovar Saopaulo str. Sao Paulo = ATCC 700523]